MTFESDVLADDARRAKEANVAAETKERQRLEDYHRTFLGSPHGWRVLQDLLGVTAVLGSAFNGNSRDIYALGRRSVGMHILETLGINTPEGMMLAAVRGAIHDPAMRRLLADDLKTATQKIEEEEQHG